MEYQIYRCYGPNDELLYIGMTGNIGSRFSWHKRRSPWYADMARMETTVVLDETEARVQERALIETLRPLHNRPVRRAQPKATTTKKGDRMSTTIRATNVWTSSVSARQSRDVSRALNAAGYEGMTIAKVRELRYVNAIAAYCEPGDLSEQNTVRRLICEAAGIQPHRS